MIVVFPGHANLLIAPLKTHTHIVQIIFTDTGGKLLL